MPDSDDNQTAEQDALKREAYRWVARLTSGEATQADAEALERWRRTSPAHRQAFAEANLLWDKMRPAAAQAAGRAAVPSVAAPRLVGRRALLGGAVAASAAGLVYVAARPPLGLWPSLAEMASDYRTGIGQQQQVALDGRGSVTLNTRTSITVRAPETDESDRIELISGEAAITVPPAGVKPLVVVAAQGRTIATQARFNIRHDDTTVCVSCLEGEVRVEQGGQVSTVRSHQQIVYSAEGLGAASDVDPDVVTAWQRGLLVFRNDPLARVVAEVNRYRPGKIVLMSEELGRRPVLATFRIDRIDEVVPRLQAVFGIPIKTLPGGIALVG